MTMAARDTRAIRREQVERCLSTTGMTIKDWCELNGVPTSTMYFWMSKFRKEEPELFGKPNASEWIEVTRESIAAKTALATREGTTAPAAASSGKTMAGSAEAPAGSAVIVRLNGADVVVPDGAAEQHIASVLRAVASL